MLTLFHDYTSPTSAVAVARLQRLIDEGVRARIVGMEAVGIDVVLPVTLDTLAELEAVGESAAAEGLTLRRPRMAPPTALAHVVEVAMSTDDRVARWRQCCYAAYWADGADLSDAAVLRRIAAVADLPGDVVEAALNDRVALLAVRQRSAGLRRDGIGGVPTISYARSLVPGLLSTADLRTLAELAG